MALSNTDIKEIEKITRKEMKDFLESTQAHNLVIKMIQKELGTKTIDEKIWGALHDKRAVSDIAMEELK